jgi:hypothetical protein
MQISRLIRSTNKRQASSGRPSLHQSNLFLTALLLFGTLVLGACGSSSSHSAPNPLTLSGNWQFTVANPPDNSFTGGVQGGFLLQNNGTVTGALVYSVSLPNASAPCNSGSVPVTGTISGQTVTITAVAGTQTFVFTGMLSTDSSTIVGTYTSTAGTASDGSSCGTAQTGLQWSGAAVPPITGAFQGSFHSTGGVAGLSNQDFAATGLLTQGPNVGATSASVSGTLTFVIPPSLSSDYPCFDTASVNGQISGTSVILQIVGSDGSNLGQIGGPSGSSSTTGIQPVTFDTVQGGSVLHGVGPSYLVASKACGGSLGSTVTSGDFGNICFAFGTSQVCQQPLTLTPALVTFPTQILGAAPTSQTISVSNSSAATLNGLTLSFTNFGDNLFNGQSDFTGLPSFTEQDTCAATPGTSFSLTAGQSCTVTVKFAPQESCPWLPFGSPPSISGAAPEWCPLAQSAQVSVNSPASADGDKTFAVPITGIGMSAIVPSTSELDFGSEAVSEASLPQLLTFTNMSAQPVQILHSATQACTNPPKGQLVLPYNPLVDDGRVSGLQVVSNGPGGVLPITPNGSTISYNCDSDPGTLLPNFQISSDTCTGSVLTSQASCSLQLAYIPQPNTNINSGLDFFLELNTEQCFGATKSNCELDSGRFPVELKANTPSPFRMSPGAGMDFGNQPVGQASGPLSVTIFNDPTVANPQTISFVGRVQVSGSYSETDDCSATLAPGSSCTLTATFKPKTVGFIPGTLTINYSPSPTGTPQFVYLRGTGQ